MAGPGESGLGHPGWHPHPGVGGQWCQSQLGDTSLCPPAQPGGAPNLRAGPLPQSLPGSPSISRAGWWSDRAIGLHLTRVQVEGMPHYDEQQVIFVLDDPSPFSARIPVILGTPTINRVIQTMKETEMHSTLMEWQMARVIYEWAQGFQFHWASLGERLKFPTNTAEDPLDLDKKVLPN